jgi:RimJ/RimL family protein N-acetyltransferase
LRRPSPRPGVGSGQQDILATEFALRRVVSSGSWLGLPHQGRGIGTEMRSAMLHFAFAGLGAERAQTDAYEDNPRSLGVTARLGYEPNGVQVGVRDGEPITIRHFVLTRARWETTRRDDVGIEGLDAARSLFGA